MASIRFSVSIDGAIQIGPFAADLEIGLVPIPTDTRATPPPVPALAELFAHDRQQLRFPVPDGLVAHLDAPQEQELTEVAQCQTIAQTAEHHKSDDIAG
jgi:hypothetical protein